MPIAGEEVFDVVLQVLVAVLYGYVAWIISRRQVSEVAQTANQGFAAWWWGLALVTGIGVLRTIKVWFIEPTLPGYTAYLYFVLLVIMLAFTGLLYYFLYLWSGRANMWVPVAVFYLGLFVFFVYYIELQNPVGFDAEGAVEYANDLSGTLFANLVSVLWLLPPILGAAAYMTLLRKVDRPLMRFRIGMVAGSVIVWFLISIGGSLAQASTTTEWWHYVSSVVSAIVAILTVIAYRPPAWVRKRFRLDPPEPPELLPDVGAHKEYGE